MSVETEIIPNLSLMTAEKAFTRTEPAK